MTAGFLGAFLQRAALEPERPAFVFYTEAGRPVMTCRRLLEGGRRWAALFRANDAKPGDVVLISLPLGPALLEAFVGALIAGLVPSLMPMPTPKQDAALFWSSHDRLFTRLSGGVIATTAANVEAVTRHVTGVAMRAITPEEAAGVAPDEQTAIHSWQGGDVACLQHSSGTTGLKKGVALTFDAIDAQLEALGEVLGLEGGDTIVSWLPLYHDMGFVACLLQPLRTGVTGVLLDPFAWLLDPLSFFEAIADHRGTLAWLPNFAFAHLGNAAQDDTRRVDLSSLRALIDCSETCRSETLAAFAERFGAWGLRQSAVRTSYAMAETVFAVTQSSEAPRTVTVERAALEAGRVVENGGGVALVSSGRPLPGVDLAVLDDDGSVAPEKLVGQIAVAAPFLFAGYHLEPERTAASFLQGRFVTGDRGFRIGDDLFVLGRQDDLIIVLGRNVFAHEIEALLAGVSGLKRGRVLAMGLDDEAIGSQELVIVAEMVPGADARETRLAVRTNLESVLGITPRKVVFVHAGWLVKSTSGKMARTENRRKYLSLQASDARRSA